MRVVVDTVSEDLGRLCEVLFNNGFRYLRVESNSYRTSTPNELAHQTNMQRHFINERALPQSFISSVVIPNVESMSFQSQVVADVTPLDNNLRQQQANTTPPVAHASIIAASSNNVHDTVSIPPGFVQKTPTPVCEKKKEKTEVYKISVTKAELNPKRPHLNDQEEFRL